MKLEAAIQYITSQHVNMTEKIKENITKALQCLDECKGFLDAFNEEDLESLYKIEMINPVYFPGLSIAASRTMLNVHAANPALPVAVLLKSADNSASRGRPWQHLGAISRIATSCPKQINAEMLSYLARVNSDILEVSSYDIEEEMQKGKSNAIGFLFSLVAAPIVEVDIKATIEHKQAHYGYR